MGYVKEAKMKNLIDTPTLSVTTAEYNAFSTVTEVLLNLFHYGIEYPQNAKEVIKKAIAESETNDILLNIINAKEPTIYIGELVNAITLIGKSAVIKEKVE